MKNKINTIKMEKNYKEENVKNIILQEKIIFKS